MSIDVELNISKILDSYEITNSGILPVVKNTEMTEHLEIYTSEDIAEDDEEFPEGKELTKLHMRKERNPKVVLKKKKKVLQENGNLKCEVCNFDFVKFYGHLGYGFAECHHTIPVSELTDGHKTKLSDLVIVCANCHRMLHKARPLISVSDLRAIIKKVSVK